MGLFDVFKKKDCEICGKEVGMFGYKKLEDGEICKDCVKLLSPWFEERRHSTVAQIKEQLAYREQNRNELANFHPQMRLGEHYPVHVELSGGIPSRFVVQRTNDYREENADIISFRNVRTFEIDVEEHERELKHRNSEGESVSYNPPRYEFSYDFYAHIQVDSPYFNELRFRLHSSTLNLETVKDRTSSFLGALINKGFDPTLYPEYRELRALADELETVFRAGIQETSLTPQAAPTDAPVADSKAASAVEYESAAIPKFCPNCGASTNGAKFCQNCGNKLL